MILNLPKRFFKKGNSKLSCPFWLCCRYRRTGFFKPDCRKIAGGESFPHEIGIVLGYPPEDIEGFKRYKGRNFKCCGYWKVYGNAERAQKMFDAYTLCREKLMQALQNGVTLKVAAAAI